MPITDPVELKLRIKKSKKQGEGKLLEYMLNHPTLGSAEAVMEACRAYWMPLAFVKAGESNAAVLREVGWKAIGELEMQIKLIKRVLQLSETPSSDYVSPVQPAAELPVPAVPMAVSPVAAVPVASVPAATTERTKTPEELDDELGANDF